MSESTGVFITTVLFVLVIVNILGNSLVCAIIKKNRELRTPINYLLVNLAVADILYAAFIAPRVFFQITSIHPDGLTGTVLCKVLTDGNVAWIGGSSSIVTFVAIAIERYFAVMYPHGNKWKLTKAKLKVIIPASWVFAVLLIVPMFIVKDVEKSESGNICMYVFPEEWMGRAYTITWNVVFFLPLALMIGLYSKVVHTLWFKGGNDNHLTHRQQGVMRVRKRVTLMVVAVTVIFGICWGTNEVVYAIEFVASYYTGPIPMAIANTMVLVNSAVNPFVYALLNQQFREKMKKMLCCIGSSAPRVRPMRERLSIETADITKPNNITRPCSTE